jgi:signal transduction histidine kinase
MVEQSIILLFTVIRGFMVVQIGISVAFQLGHLPVTAPAIAAALVAGGYSIAWIVRVNLTGRFEAWPWGVADAIIAIGALVVCGLTLPATWIIGTWLNWTVAYCGRMVVFVAAWNRSVAVPLAVSLITAGTFAAVALPGNQDQLVAVLENVVDFPFFALASVAFFTVARRVAHNADAHRSRAIQLGAELELLRFRAHVHDATGLLSNLAKADIPVDLLPSLREQAAHESNRLRRELLDPRPRTHSTAQDSAFLDAVVWDAAASFPHLPLEIAVTLGREVPLSPPSAEALRSAITALLFNVQFHAHASQVTIHADHDATSWELSVCDDGVGFNPQPDHYHFGLSTQVVAALEAHSMSVTIDSEPGSGTVVLICGHYEVSA